MGRGRSFEGFLMGWMTCSKFHGIPRQVRCAGALHWAKAWTLSCCAAFSQPGQSSAGSWRSLEAGDMGKATWILGIAC